MSYDLEPTASRRPPPALSRAMPRELHDALALVAAHTPNMVVVTDARLRIEWVNRSFERVTGFTLAQVHGQRAGTFLRGPDTDRRTARRVGALLEAGQPVHGIEILNYARDGRPYWTEMHIEPVRGPDGGIVRFISIQADITQRKRSELALIESERALREAQRLAGIGNWSFAVAARRMDWSPEVYRILGLDPSSTRARRSAYLRLVHPEDLEAVRDLHRRALSCAEPCELEHRLLFPNGRQKWVVERIHVERDGLGVPVHALGTIQDITARKRAEEHALRLARYDSLTGLPNRAELERRLREAIAEAAASDGKVAALFVDIDHFKSINDTLGHTAGDIALGELATILKRSIRERDFVARLGGDEFVLVLPAIEDADAAVAVARRLLDQARMPIPLPEQEVVMSLSIGIALYPDDSPDAATLLQHADAAMYQVKRAGRNGFDLYRPVVDRNARMRLEIQRKLRRALADEEFELHYQPKVDRQGTVLGAEALLRWTPPGEAPIPPDLFIPIAEESGFIADLGRWVLRTACRQISAWQRSLPRPVGVAVNVSARQLQHPDFVQEVESALRDSGADPELLMLEITETAAMSNAQQAREVLLALGSLGVRAAIDDFGTGYSSLSYLKLLQLKQLKIDRTFVRDILEDVNDRAIASGTIAIAHSLGLDVVAEGVETHEQMLLLVEMGCDQMQGYLFGKPMPAQALAAAIENREIAAGTLVPV